MLEPANRTSILSRWVVGAAIFVSTWMIAACFEHSRDWNTTTRFLLTHALVDHGTIEISRYVAQNGQLLEHPPTRDLATSEDGRFFCDKAPGLSVLGTIPYFIYRQITGHTSAVNATGPNEPSDYWVTLGTVGLAAAIVATTIFGLAMRWGTGLLAAAVISIGSIACTYQLVYATLYYGHILAGALVLISFAIAVRPQVGSAGMFVAGTLAGLAISVEYTAALFSAWVVFIGIATRIGIRKKQSMLPIAAFVAGYIAPLGLLAYYHDLVTGSPFRVPYSLESSELFSYHREGMGIPISLPTTEAAFGLLIGPTTGLVWYAFIVMASIPGIFLLIRHQAKVAAALICLTFASLFVVIAGFPTWHGGLSTGPRLLLPALPLLIAPAAIAMSSLIGSSIITNGIRILFGAILAISFVAIAALNAAGGRMPVAVTNPWQQYLWPMIRENQLEGHVGKWLFPSLDAMAALALTIVIVGMLGILPILLAWRLDPREKISATNS